MQKLIKNLNFLWNKFKKTNEEFWDEIEEQLILSDVSYDTASSIIKNIREYSQKENINDIEIIKRLLKDEAVKILKDGYNGSIYRISSETPTVWMMVGVNGVGKTSSIAKLANYFKNAGRDVLLTAADTFRAAAFEQINHFAQILDLPIVHHQRFSDPGAVVYDSLEKAVAKDIEMVLIDTAGRMHTSYNLMEELKKIKKVINKKIKRDPDEILMVIDSTTGQNARMQVEVFNEAVNLSGLILTKTDGSAKGGIVLTIKKELNIPVKFLTNGEKLENIEVFDPIKYAGLLFD